jgi:hypothetical protein
MQGNTVQGKNMLGNTSQGREHARRILSRVKNMPGNTSQDREKAREYSSGREYARLG